MQTIIDNPSGSFVVFIICAFVQLSPVYLIRKFSKRNNHKKCFLVFLGFTILYILVVPIPFHFQGYSEVPTNVYLEKRIPLGWTSYWFVFVFSYFFSGAAFGLSWLAISVISLIYLSLILKKPIYYAITFVALILSGVFISNLFKYEIINYVLE